MSSDVCVMLLITGVHGDVVKVVITDDDGEEMATDGGVGSEGALLVDVGGVDGGLGNPEAKADVLDEAGLLSTLGELAKDALAALAEHHLSLGLFRQSVDTFLLRTSSQIYVGKNMNQGKEVENTLTYETVLAS